MVVLRIGGIYTLYYSQWKKNYKVYAFILFAGPKVHALNLGAKELTTIDRAKLVRTITRLSKIPAATKYDGKMLYRILSTYVRPQIQKCYRTYHNHNILRAALINYGLNDESEFSEMELKGMNKQIFDQAQKDLMVKMMNMYSGRGVKMAEAEDQFATIPEKEEETTAPSTGTHSATTSGTRDATSSTPDVQTDDGDDDDGGYNNEW